MIFERAGFVFCPSGQTSWMQSHGSTAVVHSVEGDNLEILFTCRDTDNRSHIGKVKTSLLKPSECELISTRPVLAPGKHGEFDCDGVSLGSINQIGEKSLIYYLGWFLRKEVPWTNFIGVGELEGSSEVIRHRENPVVKKSDADPYSLTYPWVVEVDGKFMMYYGSSTEWGATLTEAVHELRCAESVDGIDWKPRNTTILAPDRSTKEWALTRPVVWRDAQSGHYSMIFSAHSSRYRMHYATSRNGVDWQRGGECKFKGDSTGWDSDEQCYGSVFFIGNETWIVYSGNGCGATGFGLARLVEN